MVGGVGMAAGKVGERLPHLLLAGARDDHGEEAGAAVAQFGGALAGRRK